MVKTERTISGVGYNMRVKKQKRHRKIVRFYTACYGFRQPYKVLCDVTFVHHLVTNRITPADKALSNILGAPVTLFTTKCAVAELKMHGPSLGPSHSESLEAANSLITARYIPLSCFLWRLFHYFLIGIYTPF